MELGNVNMGAFCNLDDLQKNLSILKQYTVKYMGTKVLEKYESII